MTVYCGVDFHARQQTISYCDTGDGEIHRCQLLHQRDDVRGFYARLEGEVIVGHMTPEEEAAATAEPGDTELAGSEQPTLSA